MKSKKIILFFAMFLFALSLIAQPPPPDPDERGEGCPVFASNQTYTVHHNVPAGIWVNMVSGWNDATITYPRPDPKSAGVSTNGVGGSVSAENNIHINDTFWLASGYTYGTAKYLAVAISKVGCSTVYKTLQVVIYKP